MDSQFEQSAPAPHPHQSFSVPSNADLLRAKTRLAITRVFKTYLDLLEQVAEEHDEAMGKLIDALPPEHKASVYLADHFGEARFAAIRRRVLETGNDSIREVHEMIDALRLDHR
jgi:hypothetical protein